MTTSRPAGFLHALSAIFVAVFLLISAARVSGVPVPMPPGIPRPGFEAGPTRISIGLWAGNIMKIDSVEQTFEASLFVVLRWRDPGLTHSGPGIKTYALEDVWHPKWIAVNGDGSLRQTLPEKVEVMPDGTVIYRSTGSGSAPGLP